MPAKIPSTICVTAAAHEVPQDARGVLARSQRQHHQDHGECDAHHGHHRTGNRGHHPARAFRPGPKQARPLGQPAVAPGGVCFDQRYREGNAEQDNQRRHKPKARPQIAPKLPELIHGSVPTSSSGFPACPRHVYQCNVLLDQFVLHQLLQVRPFGTQMRQAIDHILHQVEAVQVVLYAHVEGRGDCAFFLVAPDVKVTVGSPVGQPMHQPGVAVEAKDDVLVFGEQRIVIRFAQARADARSQTAASSDRRH